MTQHPLLACTRLHEYFYGLFVHALYRILADHPLPFVPAAVLDLRNNDGIADLSISATLPGPLGETGQSIWLIDVDHTHDAFDVDSCP
jgi:hypothetical protein